MEIENLWSYHVKSFLSPLFPQPTDMCHELHCPYLCQYSWHLSAWAQAYPLKWLALSHPVQFCHILGICVAYVRCFSFCICLGYFSVSFCIVWVIILIIITLYSVTLFVFFGCFKFGLLGSLCYNYFSPVPYLFTSDFISLFIVDNSPIISLIISSSFTPFLTVLSTFYPFLCNHIH